MAVSALEPWAGLKALVPALFPRGLQGAGWGGLVGTRALDAIAGVFSKLFLLDSVHGVKVMLTVVVVMVVVAVVVCLGHVMVVVVVVNAVSRPMLVLWLMVGPVVVVVFVPLSCLWAQVLSHVSIRKRSPDAASVTLALRCVAKQYHHLGRDDRRRNVHYGALTCGSVSGAVLLPSMLHELVCQ